MPDPLPKPSFLQRARDAALRLDSWLDNAVYVAGSEIREMLEGIYAFSNRFHVSGWRRVAVELGCEGLTLGLAGSILAVALAMPAFDETKGDWFTKADIAVTFLDRYGDVIGQRGIRHNDSVELAEMPDYVVKAVLATEDRRFYEHFGIDIVGTFRALTADAAANGVVQGGSSITQQLAKNLFLSNERTIERKINEAYLAIWLETHMRKDEILKLYLDRVYMGGGTFGIEAASQYYFGKSVRDVTLSEAAMLAGLFKAPTKYSPSVNLAAARARANQVLSNMVDAGFMTEGQVYAARLNPATPVDRAATASPDYYLDWAYSEIADLSDSGALGDETVLVVKTAQDPALQKAAEDALESSLRQYGEQYNAHQGAIVVMDTDGAVRAMVGGRDYGQSQFNRATDALRQPGSSFKPFVYTTAMMNGFTPQSIVPDAPICIKNWCPQNFERHYLGPVTLTTALVHSLNTVAVRLSLALSKDAVDGRRMIIDTAHRMGIQSELKESWALPIGVESVNLLEMTGAYGVFASGGYKATPHAALEISSAKGALIYRFDPATQNPLVIDPPIIAEMNGMLNQVVERGTGRAAQLPGIKTAGKTGTTNAYRDAWFMGFTGNFVAGVWFGNDDYQPMVRMTGGTLPAMTWNKVMAFAHQGVDLKPILGVMPFDTRPGKAPAAAKAQASLQVAVTSPPRTGALSRKTAAALLDIAKLADDTAGSMAPEKTSAADFGSQSRRFSAAAGSGGVSFSNGVWVLR